MENRLRSQKIRCAAGAGEFYAAQRLRKLRNGILSGATVAVAAQTNLSVKIQCAGCATKF
jgi:hypothetical protein